MTFGNLPVVSVKDGPVTDYPVTFERNQWSIFFGANCIRKTKIRLINDQQPTRFQLAIQYVNLLARGATE